MRPMSLVSVLILAGVLFPASGFSAHTGDAAAADSAGPRRDAYLWPTDASNRITSTFAEYRTTHFHGGFDISTNGVKGYNVFAVQDGYVCEVRITPNGYGKMLFIRQQDGYISAYAHLDSFNPDITRAIRAEQRRRGTYAIDLILPPGALPVKRGAVVAHTGDTGFGPPHLHFEIRDSSMNPVNPFDVARYAVTDHIPPMIKRVLINPLSPSSTIDNGDRPKILSRFPRRNGVLQIPQTLVLHGRIGFGVEALDKSDGTWNTAGIYSLRFMIDDSDLYTMKLDRVPADETKEIDLHYDLHMILQGWGKFQKLYIDTGNNLPFYGGRPPGTGIINTDLLRQGKHTYTIACRDFSGNETRLRGQFIVNHSPILLSAVRTADSSLLVRGVHLSIARKIDCEGMNFSSHVWKELAVGKESPIVNDSTVLLPAKLIKTDLIRITAVTPWDSRTSPVFFFTRKPSESLRPVYCSTELTGGFVRLTLTSTGMFTAAPEVTVGEGEVRRRIELVPVDLYKYTGTFVPSPDVAGTRSITVKAEINGKPAFASDDIDIFAVPATHGGRFSIPPWQLKIAFDSGAVYHPLYMQVSAEEFNHAQVYIFEPQDQLINGGIRVSVPYAGWRDTRRRGLFFRSNGGWIFQTSAIDSQAGCYTATLNRTLGELAVLEDDQPPSVGRLRVTSRKKIPVISFRYADNLSGVDTDEIKVYIDDTLVIPEIDGEHRAVSYAGEDPLPAGKHNVRIIVKDRMKNETTVNRIITVR